MNEEIKNKLGNKISIFDMKRMPKIYRIKRSQIHVGDVEIDPTFYDLYEKCIKGESLATITRFCIERITPGFFKKG